MQVHPKAKRLFVAIDLPQRVKDALALSQKRIQGTHVAEGKYPKPATMHLTLKFLGNVEESLIPLVTQRLQQVAMPKLFLRLGGLGTFPESGRHIHVVWASVSGDGLADLATQIEDALAGVVQPSEHRFQAHLTLLRVTRCQDEKKLLESLKQVHVEPIEFEVEEFKLFESDLLPGGPEHHVLATFL